MNNHPRDLLRLASAFTPRRAFNAARVLANYQASRLTGKVVAPPFPISLAIEPTTSCNLRCPECPSGLRSFTRPTGMLDPDFLRSVIDQVHRDVAYLVFYFQGEPFLHPQFTDLVRYAKSKRIYTATSTNAHYLSPEKARETVASGLDRLIISIDGTTQDTYSQYRVGGSLEKVLEERATSSRRNGKQELQHPIRCSSSWSFDRMNTRYRMSEISRVNWAWTGSS